MYLASFLLDKTLYRVAYRISYKLGRCNPIVGEDRRLLSPSVMDRKWPTWRRGHVSATSWVPNNDCEAWRPVLGVPSTWLEWLVLTGRANDDRFLRRWRISYTLNYVAPEWNQRSRVFRFKIKHKSPLLCYILPQVFFATDLHFWYISIQNLDLLHTECFLRSYLIVSFQFY